TLLKKLVARPVSSINISPAAIYRYAEELKHPTFLIDELSVILSNSFMRQILNGAYMQESGGVDRFIGGEARSFHIFAPFALAGNDALYNIPLDTLRRCIVLDLQRSPRTFEEPKGLGFEAQCALLVDKMRS